MSKNRAVPATETAVVFVGPAIVPGMITNPNSIRQIIITRLLAGQDTKTIAAEVQAKHPNSAAAAKSVKHIAFYRSQLRKSGQLPKYVPQVPTLGAPVAETEAPTAE